MKSTSNAAEEMNATSVVARNDGCDVALLSITPFDRLVLFTVTGQTTVADIAVSIGVGQDEALRSVQRLVDAGAMSMVVPKPAPSEAPQPTRTWTEQETPRVTLLSIPRVADRAKFTGGPVEQFVFSQIDGALAVADLGAVTGLSEAEVLRIVMLLVDAGAVAVEEAAPRSFGRGSVEPSTATYSLVSERPARPKKKRSSSHMKAAKKAPSSARQRAVKKHPSTPRQQVVSLADGARSSTPPKDAGADATDLSADLQRKIQEMALQMDELDHYSLLGVAYTASAKQIREGYYQRVSLFHPDKYFGKRLGPFKPKLERIFARVSDAFETLNDEDRRARYDATLRDAGRLSMLPPMPGTALDSLAPESSAAPSSTPPTQPGRASPPSKPPVETSRKASTPPASIAPPRSSPPAARVPSGPPVVAKAAPSAVPPPAAPTSARPQAAAPAPPVQGAARVASAPPVQAAPRSGPPLRASGAPEGAARTSGAPAQPSLPPTGDPNALKRMYELRRSQVAKSKAAKFVEAAEEALAKKDVVAAGNLYQIALAWAEEPEVEKHVREAFERVRVPMGEASLARARELENAAQWGTAAMAYQRAYEATHNPEHAERAAHAFLRDGKDIRKAVRLGEEAVTKGGGRSAFRVTLAEVYRAAGLSKRATSELERALAADPKNLRAASLLRQWQAES